MFVPATTGPYWHQFQGFSSGISGGYRREQLRLVYTNDTHEKYQSMPNMVTAFRQLSEEATREGRDVLRVAAGDWNISNESNQMTLNVLLHNLMGVQASTLGNHEFDGGARILADGLQHALFKVLATNLHIPQGSALFQRWQEQKLLTGPQVMTTENGSRYGLVGLTVPSVWKYLNPDAPMEGVASQEFEAALQRLQADVDRLQQAGVNKIILLSHAGYERDCDIAQKTRGIDIIVGGHTHTELKGIQPGVNYLPSASGEPVMIVQTGKDARALGTLDVSWDAFGRVQPLQNTLHNPRHFAKNPMAVEMVDRYLGPERPIAVMSQDYSTENVVTGGEDGVANKVADAVWNATNADIALFRGTEVRCDIFRGSFSDRDLNILLPFNDKLALFQMTGRDIMAALNESGRCLKIKEDHPGIIHGGGLRYAVDMRTGQATDVTVFNKATRQWEPLVMQKTYTVATGEFMAKNKKEYPVFKQVPLLKTFAFNAREVFGQWLQSQQGRPITFSLDGRLRKLNEERQQWPNSPQQNPQSLATVPWNASSFAPGYTTRPMFASRAFPKSLKVYA